MFYDVQCVLFSSVAIKSLDCLSALLLKIVDIHLLGHLLGLSKDIVVAIDSHYSDHSCKIKHTVAIWLMNDPNDPVIQMRKALNALGEDKLAQELYLLTSLGKLMIDIS